MFDVITIGSSTIDVFIRSDSKQIDIEKVNHHEDVCLPIGSKILINELHVSTGGGANNAAVSLARLGLKTGWIGILTNSHNSLIIKDLIKKEKISFLGSEINKGDIGYSVILIGLKNNRTILTYKGVNNSLKYSHVKKQLNTRWIYSSSMMGESWNTLKKILKNNKAKFAFNPSSYLAMKGKKFLMPVLKYCNLLILNKEEAQFLLNSKTEIKGLLKALQKIVPLVVITDGNNGAYSFDGKEMLRLIPKKTKIIETTGAGDAFASAFLAALINKRSIKECLLWGHAQACSVLSKIGAKDELLKKNKLLKNLSNGKVVKL